MFMNKTKKKTTMRLGVAVLLALLAIGTAAPIAADSFDGPIPACWPLCRG